MATSIIDKRNDIRALLVRVREQGFATPSQTVFSLAVFGVTLWIVWSILSWFFLDAVWGKENVSDCIEASGACWSVIDARYRLILFGLYPFDEHWRSTIACLTIIATVAASCIPWFWSGLRLLFLWIVGFATYYLFMEGGLLGLQQVTTDQWGGLSLTLFLFASVVLLGMPMGLGLALMRRSQLPLVRWMASLVIDFIRSLPLITTLFTAAVVIPLLLPEWLQGDKIWRVIVAFALFFACYQAEVFRGGFQAVEKSQFEAAAALGLGYWRSLFLVVLPQVFRHALPSSINMVVIAFKETSLIIIIGFFDVMASAKAAHGTAEWAAYYTEVYAFVAVIYWSFIFTLSRYGEYLKNRMALGIR